MPKYDPTEKTKHQILEVSSRLALEKGLDKINIETVVKELGLTRGAFYHYFKSREDLIHSTLSRVYLTGNPFIIASKQEGKNAFEKLQFALKLSLKYNLELSSSFTSASEVLKIMYEPTVFKCNLFFTFDALAINIEQLLIEGNNDGSIAVEYPKHMSHIFCIVCNEWANPKIFQMTEEVFSERLTFLEQFWEKLGIPFMDSEIKDLLTQIHKSYCK